MWVKPEEVLLANAFWETERANPFFSLQRRKGHGGGGFTSILIGTLDNVLDNKPAPFRILLQSEDSDVCYVIATAASRRAIEDDWNWLQSDILNTLEHFDSSDDAKEFVKAKVVSLLATHTEVVNPGLSGDNESAKFQAACSRFKRLFSMPEEEKLVNCKACIWLICAPANFICINMFILILKKLYVIYYKTFVEMATSMNFNFIFSDCLSLYFNFFFFQPCFCTTKLKNLQILFLFHHFLEAICLMQTTF